MDHCFLGLRRGRMTLGIDPVIPKALDGLCAEVELGGHTVRVRYRVAAKGCGPIALTLNGQTLPMTREKQSIPYRGRHRPDGQGLRASVRRDE